MKNYIELKVLCKHIGMLNDILGRELDDLRSWEQELGEKDQQIAKDIKVLEQWMNQIRCAVLGK